MEIPNSVETIGNNAFAGCSGLTSVKIPNPVETIGSGAFQYCTGLKWVEIPSSVSTIGSYAFYNCYGLTEIVSLNTTPPSAGLNSLFTSDCVLKVPEESVNAYRWADGWIDFDKIVAYVEPKLENCVILYTSKDGNVINPHDSSAFNANIVSNTYENGQGKLQFGIEVTSIGFEAFYKCSSLTSVELPSSVTQINYEAFYGCGNLKSMKIPNLVTYIGSNAFSYCSDLTSVEIPNSVTEIGHYAFFGCYNIKEIYSKAILPPTCGTNVFERSVLINATLYVDNRSVSRYQLADTWKDFYIEAFDFSTGIDMPTAEEDGPSYNLNGQRVGEGFKGIVVKDGKKFIKR